MSKLKFLYRLHDEIVLRNKIAAQIIKEKKEEKKIQLRRKEKRKPRKLQHSFFITKKQEKLKITSIDNIATILLEYMEEIYL